MKRLALLYLIVGTLFIATLGVLWWRVTQVTQAPATSLLTVTVPVYRHAPAFDLPLLDGSTLTLTQLRGRKAILNFWASWCGPCRAEMPHLESLYQRYKERLLVVGINIAEESETVRRFLERVRVTYPVLLDAQGRVARAYGVIAQPATYWIDERGQIIYRKFGAYSPSELEDIARAFLALPPAP
ncbi:MAG: TlpA family protein disulfide reductase [Candidatus Bipolaricaulota bacterium]|nr:TlpA family protein disulfide reductase [Candidatus Bipolaricaulota bacterium]MCS7274715.1 TlpA family protein disulfide reductase [Candidatus Bipolaricaulota bacterium]MDW8109992.1 TlpA disulfide reductase family protein [Candidatus Bipolaricaulota bacterium]MDW8328936.1 TlpA disulfide reductase family protein [Candidatus Bipolaricaulota bacterium]